MNNKGFTLVEIIAAVGIGMVMLAAIYAGINSAQRSSAGIERKVTAQQDARAALELMAMEIRMASFNTDPTNNGIWLNPSDCSLSTSPTYRGIRNATSTSLTIETDVNESGSIGDGPNEIIAYNYNAVTQIVTRENKGKAPAPSGGCSTGGAWSFLGDTVANQRTVWVINNQNGIPVFRYFGRSGDEIFPGTTPSETPNIRTIEITLAVSTADIDPATGQRRRLIYSTRVTPRNHAITIQ